MNLELGITAEGQREDPIASDGERELVRRARTDREAFAQLYRANVRAVSDYVYRRTGDEHVTQDVVSDVFMRALRSISRLEWRRVPFRHWLLRIATNCIYSRARRAGRERTEAEVDGRADVVVAGSRPGAGKDSARRALDALPKRYQAVLTLRHVEGLSTREVASVLGCSEGTIKSRLARGRELLRKVLSNMENDHDPS